MIVRVIWSVAIILSLGLADGAAQGNEQVAWKFAVGDVHHFKMAQQMHIEMEVPDVGPASSDVEQQLHVTWKVEEVRPDGAAVIALSIDRVQLKLEMHGGQSVEFDTRSQEPPQGFAAMMGPTLEAVTSTPIKATMNPRGKVTDVDVPDELSKALANAPGASLMGDIATEAGLERIARQASIELPEELEPGAEWTATFEVKSPKWGGAFSTENRYVYEGDRDVDGQSMAVFTSTSQLEFAPGDVDEGLSIEIGEQESTGEILFNRAAGRLESSTLEQELALVIDVQGKKVLQEMRQDLELRWTSQPEE